VYTFSNRVKMLGRHRNSVSLQMKRLAQEPLIPIG
jgi:hypothetical protein